MSKYQRLKKNKYPDGGDLEKDLADLRKQSLKPANKKIPTPQENFINTTNELLKKAKPLSASELENVRNTSPKYLPASGKLDPDPGAELLPLSVFELAKLHSLVKTFKYNKNMYNTASPGFAHPRNLKRATEALNKSTGLIAAEVIPETINANGGYTSMSKYKRKYGVGGPVDGTIDQTSAMDTVGSATNMIPGIGAAISTGMKLNNLQADLGNSIMMEHSDNKEFLAKEQQRGKWMNSINPAVGMAYRIIGAKGRLQEFNKNKKLESQALNAASGYANDANVTFAHGGSLNEFNGPSHEDGGVTITNNDEVEGKETMMNNDYIFSDRLKPKGSKQSYAQLSKKFKSRYTGKRPTDKISKDAEERELGKLQEAQEIHREEIMNNAYMKAYGGPKSKRGFLEEKEFRREYDKYSEATGNSSNPYDVEHYYDYSKMFDETGGIMPNLSNDNHLPSEYKELGHPNLYVKGQNTKQMGNGGSIHIKPENRGKFNATKARTGKTTEELTHSSNPLTRKRAIFAQNAAKWKHAEGGNIYGDRDIMDILQSNYLPTQQLSQLPNEVPLNINGEIQPLLSQVYDPLTDNRQPQVYNKNYQPNVPQVLNPDSYNIPELKSLPVNIQNNNKPGLVPMDNQLPVPLATSPNTNSNFGGADAFDYASIAAQLGSTAFDLYQNRKIDPVNYKRFSPKTVNMDKARINANKAINDNLNSAAYGIKQNAPNASSYLANRRALGIKGAELAGTTAADISQKEELANTDIYNKAGEINTNISNREIEDYAKNKGQVLENRSTAVGNLATGIAGAGSTIKKYRIQKMIASQLGTNDFKVNSDGTVTYKKNGVEVTEKIG